jgi:(4-alkanoyl-5-oxo-2,5-dihydrofuran-3-yl)methyl phosphate reductase
VSGSGVPWTFLRPTNFASNSLAWAPAVKASGTVRAPIGEFRYAVIDPRDIASVAVAALTEPGHQGKAYPLTGPEALSVAGQVAVIGEVLGREVIFIEQTEAEASADMLSRGMPAQVVESLLAGQRAGLRVAPVVHDTVERVTGGPPAATGTG